MQLKLGCDPEVFMVDLQGHLRSSIGRIGGTKTSPQPLKDLGEGFAVQEDNVAMEFNIPPASNAKEYVESINKVLTYLKEGIQSAYGYDISRLSAASWPEEELQTPQAQVFGCDPDYNAWTGKANPRPEAADKTLRSCGGHVHVGFDKQRLDSRYLIKCMDLYHGVPSVLMDNGELRKNLYGKRGAYREKPFGAEYRVLSNFWIFQRETIEWVWRNTERAIAAVEARFPIEDLDDMILQAIDNNDKAIAEQLVKQFNLEVVHV